MFLSQDTLFLYCCIKFTLFSRFYNGKLLVHGRRGGLQYMLCFLIMHSTVVKMQLKEVEISNSNEEKVQHNMYLPISSVAFLLLQFCVM